MEICIAIPVRSTLLAKIRVPDEALDDIAGFLEDNPEYLDDIESKGYEVNRQLMLLDAALDG